MLDGVYPERIKCSAVEEPIVPPPPTMTTLVESRDSVIWRVILRKCLGTKLETTKDVRW